MKISYNWLKDYINIDKTADEVGEMLTNCGLEVEAIEKYESVKGGLKGVVVGEVVTKIKHPDADKLSLTRVNIGNGKILDIVCGAPNVKAGQKVPVATVGTTIYKGEESIVIKKSKIRGSVSEGMICAEDELGLGKSHDGIMVLDKTATVGMPAREYFNVTDDTIFEIGLTPNRPDATSHIGVARDLYAVIQVQSSKFKAQGDKINIPSVNDFKVDNRNLKIEVEIEDKEACPRYSGITISGITVKESPEWMKQRLQAIGVRPINNIVDITNYVMMETGQPLHAFDAEEIKGRKVIIKKLAKGTKFVTLDEKERELTDTDLMICNAEEGMCIAGVFGGIKSGININTKSLFLESAYFNPRTIRKTSKYHGLSTDSSFRFERGGDPNITVYALKRASMLIKQIAGGEISSDIADIYPEQIEDTILKVHYENIYKLIGKTIDKEIIKTILEALGIKILDSRKDTEITVSIPPFKRDVKREADIAEEILRIYGYNNIEIPETVKLSLSYTEKPYKELLQNKISDYLSSNGFNEIYSNSLTKSTYTDAISTFLSENNVKIINPISAELNVMRQTLLFGGLETIVHNYNRKKHDLKIYEFGNTYQMTRDKRQKSKVHSDNSYYIEESRLSMLMTGRIYNETWKTPDENVSIFEIKYHITNILRYTGLEISNMKFEKYEDDIFGTGIIFSDERNNEILRFGELTKKILEIFGIKTTVFYADINWDNLVELSEKKDIKYKEVSKYPEVRRDIAMLIDKGIQYSDIEKLVYSSGKKLLKKVDLFDVYEGEKIGNDKKSYAISLIMQDEEKTLTDNEVDRVIEKIKGEIIKEFKAIIR